MWSEESLSCLFIKILSQGKSIIMIKFMELNHINVRLRNLPKECEEEPEETITSEVGDLEDDDISLNESLTEDMATVDNSRKIPIGSNAKERMRSRKRVSFLSKILSILQNLQAMNPGPSAGNMNVDSGNFTFDPMDNEDEDFEFEFEFRRPE